MRFRFVFAIALLTLIGSISCGSKTSSPTQPSTTTPTPTPAAPTRIIRLDGSMNFGDVQVGTSKSNTLSVYNDGNATLTFTGLTGSNGITAVTKLSLTSGSVPAGGKIDISVAFTPAAETTYSGQIAVTSDATSGANSIAVSGRGIQVCPRTQFGAGQYLVNSDIVPGRYFAAISSGCYWERESGLGGTLGEIIANDFLDFSSQQWIVDIAGSDKAFKTESGCNTWFMTPRAGAQTNIPPGAWLMGSQISAGTYRVSAGSGCYWERRRDFSGSLSGIIANDFIANGGSVLVQLSSNDAGFTTDGDCGTWTKVSSEVAEGWSPQNEQSPGDIAHNRSLYEAKHGGR
jgi:hypothetical protein